MHTLLAHTRLLVQELNDLVGLTGCDRPSDPVPAHLAYSEVVPTLRVASSLAAHPDTGSAALWSDLAHAIDRLGQLGPSLAALADSGALNPGVVAAYHDLLREHRSVLEDWQAMARALKAAGGDRALVRGRDAIERPRP